MASEPDNTEGQRLDGGTYEVVLKRLQSRANELGQRCDALDARRCELFGASSVELITSVKVRTEHACTPRDVVAVGGRLIFGYHAVLGLKAQVAVSDVFAELAVDGDTIVPSAPALLTDPTFAKEFSDLFRYYKEARLLQLRRPEGRLLASFQTGSRVDDRKVLRWDLLGQGSSETLRYLDNRGDQDDIFPPSHDFAWVRCTREQHVHGEHPHINILDTLFVECVGGDLTIKVEDNTESGSGILAEPVDDSSQGLDDAEIFYADLAPLILLRIRPYKEQAWRHFVYNRLTREARRLDAIGVSCQQLPEGHGLVFPGGMYLADGSCKTFPIEAEGLTFQRLRRSPNGEDFLYVFYQRGIGRYVLLRYNLVQRQVDQPLAVNGFTLLPDGRLVVFRAEDEPSRLHTLQLWRTPFAADTHVEDRPTDGSLLGTLGNRELARAVGDLRQLTRAAMHPRPVRDSWIDLLRQIQAILDGYHWLGEGEAFGLRSELLGLHGDASTVLEEFQKVEQLSANATAQVAELETAVANVCAEAAYGTRRDVAAYVEPLVTLRRLRGRVASQREVRYSDTVRLDACDARLAETISVLAKEAAGFLQRDDALTGIDEDLASIEAAAGRIAGAVEAAPLQERLDVLAAGLEALVDVANSLELDDARSRTAIIDRIGATFGRLNRARAVLDGRRRDLATHEARADFNAALTLLAQGATNALALCSSIAACDEQLSRLMLHIEELEGRFAEFDEFSLEVAERRAEIADGFSAKRQTLLDERQQRAERLATAADRVLGSISKRLQACADLDELNAVLASDALVSKLRQVIDDLRGLDATVKAEDCESRLKAARDDAARRLRDRAELFDGDGVKLGRHRFAVNREALTLTTIVRDGRLCVHVTGTDYLHVFSDPAVDAARDLWALTLPSESPSVYRGEYAAWLIWHSAAIPTTTLADPEALPAAVHAWMADRYEDGYERGVHDHDAACILHGLTQLQATAGELTVAPGARARALLVWAGLERPRAEALRRQARSLRHLAQATAARQGLAADCAALAAAAAAQHGLPADTILDAQAGRFLSARLSRSDHIAVSGLAHDLARHVREHAASLNAGGDLRDDLAALRGSDPAAAWRLAQAWCLDRADAASTEIADEAVAILLCEDRIATEAIHARTTLELSGLLGRHPRIREGRLTLRLDDLAERLERHLHHGLPAWRAWQAQRRDLLDRERGRLRLDELSPRVLSSFVRNRLVNEVYLPLVGDNLAKQMGALGESRRSDLMGLLLLISPPGYGKTTLLEYLAATLGLAFVKINGPALGHEVTNLDPAAAAAAPARQELEKLNLALELGNNVLLMIDDIQHCSGEFLQKFISLCDGTRSIEGVWQGHAKRYDLRGKRFVVAMAGNPYTESGGRFRVPDMLANRADTYNLGDIVGGNESAFADSYVENCLVVNPVLKPITTRPTQDVGRLLRAAAGDESARGDLEHPYTAVELQDILTVLSHCQRIRAVLMQVNATYISSAAQNDAYRSEPPFFLQGSYRNMAKIAGKILPAMTAAEVDALILDHYRQESQTLTVGAEQNLLKLKAMLGILSDDERTRWDHICRIFTRRTELGGDEDPARIAANQLNRIVESLDRLHGALPTLADGDRSRQHALIEHLVAGIAELRKVPVAEPKVEIVNTIPKYYGKLYQHHMQVIEHTLIPLVERLGTYIGDTTATRNNLSAVAQDLRGWLSRQTDGNVLRLEDSKEQPDLG